MPIIKFEPLSQGKSYLIWNVEESLTALIESLKPYDLDLEYLSEISNEIKRMEFATGRLAIKRLVEEAGMQYKGVYKDQWGKQFLVDSDYHISLSHCYPYVAAILNKTNSTGIDIQILRDKLIKLAPKFLNKTELDFADNHLEKIGILWAAKEALYKVYGRKRLIFSQNLEIASFKLHHTGRLQGFINNDHAQLSMPLTYLLEKDYVLCFSH